MHTATASGTRASARARFRCATPLPDIFIALPPPCGSRRSRHPRPGLEHGAQCLFQRSQPWFEAGPMIQAAAVDRLAHLFIAGGTHRALVLEEAQASGSELDPAMRETPPNHHPGDTGTEDGRSSVCLE